MRTNEGSAVRGWLCALVAVGTVLANASYKLSAQEQQAPASKPAEVYQTLFLSSSDGQQDANDVQTVLRNLLPRTKIYYVNTSNALSIRGSAEDVALAQRVLAEIDQPRKTYRLTYTISDGGAQRHLVLVVIPGERSELKQGSRVPIVTGSNADGKTEHTEVQYLDVGITVAASLTGLGDGLRLVSKVEQTSVAEEKSNVGIQDPVIRQAVLQGEVALSPGKPVILGSMEAADGGKRVEVSVVAEVMK